MTGLEKNLNSSKFFGQVSLQEVILSLLLLSFSDRLFNCWFGAIYGIL